MRFKTDENLHPEVAEWLRRQGHDAVTVWDEGLKGKPDARIAQVCQVENRSLITLDVGFGDIRAYPPREFPGLIVLRLKDQSRPNVLELFPKVLELLTSEPLIGQLWIADEHSVRVRDGRDEES